MNLKVGDKVVRKLGGLLVIPMEVAQVTSDQVVCSPVEGGRTLPLKYTFDLATGMEIDDGMEWGPKYGATGSYLVVLN